VVDRPGAERVGGEQWRLRLPDLDGYAVHVGQLRIDPGQNEAPTAWPARRVDFDPGTEQRDLLAAVLVDAGSE
jgi:hypothetical protein